MEKTAGELLILQRMDAQDRVLAEIKTQAVKTNGNVLEHTTLLARVSERLRGHDMEIRDLKDRERTRDGGDDIKQLLESMAATLSHGSSLKVEAKTGDERSYTARDLWIFLAGGGALIGVWKFLAYVIPILAKGSAS